MLRKVILTGLIAFWAPGTVQQLLIGTTVSTFFLGAAIWKQPYTTVFNNRFKIVTDASVVLTLNIAVLLHPDLANDDESKPFSDTFLVSRIVLELLLFFFNLAVPAILIVHELLRFLRPTSTKLVEEDCGPEDAKDNHGGDVTVFANPLDVDPALDDGLGPKS